ncbi:MAG: ArsR/SmtB family transcription factor [Paracoccaceae bacterium]
MERTAALDAFSALSNGTRLDLLRLLVVAGPEGLAAGEIARRLGMSASRLSFHLAAIEQAGLARGRRAGRSVIYAADMDGIDAVIGWLMRDCCAGRATAPLPLPDPGPAAEAHELDGG